MDTPPLPLGIPAPIPDDDEPEQQQQTASRPASEGAKVELVSELPTRQPIARMKLQRGRMPNKGIIEPPRLTKKEERTDALVSRAEWEAVFKAYTETGLPKEIAQKTKVKLEHVTHLINNGCLRLGLPSIKDFAIKKSSVAKRTIAELDGLLSQDVQENLGTIQEAASKRAGLEAAAATSLMNTTLRAAEAVGGLLNKVVKTIEEKGEEAFEVPDKINLNYLRTLAKTAGDLAHAVDLASQINRRVSGQPERNLALEIANVVTMMPNDVIQNYLHTGEFPREMRLLKTSQLAQGIARGMIARGEIDPKSIIDVIPEDEVKRLKDVIGSERDPLAGTYPTSQEDQKLQAELRSGRATDARMPEEVILNPTDDEDGEGNG